MERQEFERLDLSAQLSHIQGQLENYIADSLAWFCETHLESLQVSYEPHKFASVQTDIHCVLF